MRATYRREPGAVHLPDKENVDRFVPIQRKVTAKKGKKVRILVPVTRNLIFVHACPSTLKHVKSKVTYLQYVTDTRNDEKIIIPDNEMRCFVAVAGIYSDQLLYFQPKGVNLSKGAKVHITGSDFEGQEDIFLRVKGTRNRRTVTEIQGVIIIAMATILPELIEVIR